MAAQLMSTSFSYYYNHQTNPIIAAARTLKPSPSSTCLNSLLSLQRFGVFQRTRQEKRRGYGVVVASSSSNAAAPLWDSWKPEKSSAASPSLSDIIWPSAGAFAAMAILGKMDQILAPKGVSMTIAPLGAVCAVLFATPSSPAARIGCAAIGVAAFSVFGPGWLARSAALAASIAFMILTRSNHPPAASLPILFIDGVKLHHLNFWFALFPGAAACIILCLMQEVVCFLKNNFKF
ncbi:hypothetical protein ERO13_D07G069900v2 [Gossypium hirsutum]|uniref:Uncharacterized protein isoform X2 n=3 Tax=Gossypium TaxID=3633 RepID=A0A1U8NZM8_GOSHI|nr:uncharacterized protein LOC107953515 isoform X2 [Gossypium hirsutum]KAG4137406.1 hypothetical protein ERO13_D07G069900v2 [Gossypium hirsutum]TYH61795.1 hypothetical protein ES332_D07G076800v1 [Gossypium tomentosum]TYI72648.1 hypothetical protein E1A91_D07G075500v1 [Gossypium mustelinum]